MDGQQPSFRSSGSWNWNLNIRFNLEIKLKISLTFVLLGILHICAHVPSKNQPQTPKTSDTNLYTFESYIYVLMSNRLW